MTLIAAYLLSIIFLLLIPLLLTLWTALKRQRYINRYYSNRNSEMMSEILNLQKTINYHGKEIKEEIEKRRIEKSGRTGSSGTTE